MIKSMTGFGRAQISNENILVKVEIKSVNHRYTDIFLKMPRHLNFMEESIRSTIKKIISRGKIEVFIYIEYINSTINTIKIDHVLAKEYLSALEMLKSELRIEDNIKLGNIMSLPEIITLVKDDGSEDETSKTVLEALNAALAENLKMKLVEGEHLAKSIVECLDSIEKLLVNVEKQAVLLPSVYKEKVRNRINSLLQDEGFSIEDTRIALEAAILADKSDITEEIVRLKSHIKQCRKIMNSNDPVGRKLDFIVQEMNREVNTIGSKSNEIMITDDVVEMKTQLEKIREQIQNIE